MEPIFEIKIKQFKLTSINKSIFHRYLIEVKDINIKMQKSEKKNMTDELIRFLQQEPLDISRIENIFTLETFVQCTQDQHFAIQSKLKLKLLKTFKHLLLKSVSLLDQSKKQEKQQNIQQNNKQSCIDYKKFFSYLTLLNQKKLIFLPHQEQWNEFIEIIMILILGSSYKLQLALKTKQKLLNDFVKDKYGRNKPIDSKISQFIELIQSSDLLRQLLISCPNNSSLHVLFELNFIILFHQSTGSQQNMENDTNIIPNILDQIFILNNLNSEQIKFYFNLLGTLNPLEQNQNPSIGRLYFKISTLTLIQKINQKHLTSYQRTILVKQIEQIKQNLRLLLSLRSHFINQNGEFNFQQPKFIKYLQTSLIATFLITENSKETLNWLEQIEFDDKFLLKIIKTLKTSNSLNQPSQLFNFCKQNLSFANQIIKKLKQNPSKGLKFIDHESTFSANISSECQVNFKIKTLKSKESIVLFQLVSKNKRIEIIQKTIDSKLNKMGCLQYVKNQIKSKQIQQLFDFQPTQQFTLHFQKTKVKLHLIKKVNDTTQNLKLLEIQRFQSIGSKINIGMIEGIVKETKNVQEIQKFTITSQSIKKDKTQLIEKTNIFKIAVQILERNGQTTKNSDTKMYGFKINNLCVKNYQNNFGLFAQKNHVKPIILEALKKLVNSFFKIKLQCRAKIQQNQVDNIESLVQKDFFSSIRGIVQLLKNLEDQKSFNFDDIIHIIIECFLQKFDHEYQDKQSGCNLLKLALDIIQIISTQVNPTNLPLKIQLPSIKFLTSIINCSISIYLSFIELFQQKFLSTQQTNKHTLQLFRTIIFHNALLISDPKVFKQQKTLIIQKIDSLLTKVQQNLSHKKLKYDQINEVQQTLRFLIGLLKNDKYENENHQKMRRFKLSYLLVKFLKEFLNHIKFSSQMVQNLLNSSHGLCLNKIQQLKVLILKDQQSNQIKAENQTVTTSKDVKDFPQNDQIEEIQQMTESTIVLSTKDSETKSKNQPLKDRIYLLSGYTDLFYTTQNIRHQSVQNFGSSFEQLQKFINDKTSDQSGFYSQILNKSWINFFKIFQQNFDHNQPYEFYLKVQPILSKLISYGFHILSEKTVIKMIKTLLFHPILFFTKFDSKNFYERLNKLDYQILKLIKDLIKKADKLDTFTKKNIQKSLVLLLSKIQISINALMEFQLYDLHKIQEGSLYLKALEIHTLAKILSSQCTENGQADVRIENLENQLFKKVKLFFQDNKSEKINLKTQKLDYNITYQQICSTVKSLKNVQTISDKIILSSISVFFLKFLQDFITTVKYENDTYLTRKKLQINQQKDQKKQNIQKLDKKQLLKGNLKRQISAKQLNVKIENKKDLKTQNGKDEEIFRSQQPRSTLSHLNRKIGKNITEQKILLNHIQNLAIQINFIQSGLLEVSNRQHISFNDEKIYLTSKIFQQINKNYQDLEYSIDDYCDKNGMKMMLCKKNVTKKMPKLQLSNNYQQKITKSSFKNTLENLKIIKISAELFSSKLVQKNPENTNLSKKIYDIMPTSPVFRVKQKQIGHYVDAFKVTLITNTQFYQGELKIYNYNLCDFVENKQVDLENYEQLSALESQRRKKNEILKNPISFEIKFYLNLTEYIKRKYLKIDNSIEIFTKNKSYFFVFKSQKQRDSFTAKIYQKAELNHDKIYKFTKLWQKGAMSNFQYLMQVNKFADRSFNDISQYYVFPWTVTDNKQQIMDEEFLKNTKKFRDLNKPIGKINQAKYAKIKTQYQNSKKYANSNRPVFLYSSFYSNPAIVSYYLIRLHPFSAHQYELQSGKFDQSDRLFGSIEGNYSAVYNIPGDFKELIPEFYYNPYFLKNLNQYEFGMTQKDVKINNVELPQWVRTQTPDQFVFRMRTCLQSSFVTQNLHKWIDLTFGMCAQKSKAQKYQNLYNQNVYGQNLDSQNSAFVNKFLKQFGEIPRTIFQTQHPKNLMTTYDKRRMLKKSKSLTDMLKQQLLKQQIKEYSHNQCEKLNDETESGLIKFNRKNVEKDQKDKNISKQSLTSMKSIKMFDDDNNEQADERSFLMIKQNCLISKNAYGMGYFNFSQDNKDPFDYKNKPQLSSISQIDLLTFQDSKNTQIFLLSIENSKLFGYKFNSKSMKGWKNSLNDKFQIDFKQQLKLLKTIGSYLILVNQYDQVVFYSTENYFKNKKTKTTETLLIENSTLFLAKTIKFDSQEITNIQVNEYLTLMCLKLNQSQFVVFDVREDNKIDFRVNFRVNLLFDEKILKIEIHNMGYFLIFTNKNRFILFNLLGQMILNIMICFEKQTKIKKQECITSTCFWSQQSSNILFSTNLGILYKVDLFDMAQKRLKNQNYLSISNKLPIDQFEIFKEENQDLFESFELKGQQKIVDMKMERRGRHWKVYCLGRRGNIYTLKNKYFDMAK